jgi:hypothetical protein
MDEPIEVSVVDGRPATFQWNDRRYQIFDVLHTWKSEGGPWWKPSRQGQRQHFRVQAGWGRHRITAEIFASTTGKGEQWILSEVFE